MTRETRGEGEEDLRELFARLRNEELRDIPGFTATIESAARRHRQPAPLFTILKHGWLPAMALASAALWLAMQTLSESSLESSPEFAPALQAAGWELGQWAMPTDVLLDLSSLPASDLMGDFESGSGEVEPIRKDRGRPVGINDRRVRDARSLG